MDILISSNLERLLYLMGGAELASELMAELAENGSYKVPYAILERIHEEFAGYFCSEPETAETIRSTFEELGYLVDPHTAVGLRCAWKYLEESGDSRKIILASTASAFKFPGDVCASLEAEVESTDPADLISALENATKQDAPAQLTRTLSLPIRFDRSVDKEDMAAFVFGDL